MGTFQPRDWEASPRTGLWVEFWKTGGKECQAREKSFLDPLTAPTTPCNSGVNSSSGLLRQLRSPAVTLSTFTAIAPIKYTRWKSLSWAPRRPSRVYYYDLPLTTFFLKLDILHHKTTTFNLKIPCAPQNCTFIWCEDTLNTQLIIWNIVLWLNQ